MTAIAMPPTVGQIWRAPGFYSLLCGFYLVHVLLRPWLTATAGSDDTDQLLFSQALLPGYDVSQPPLYTWLVWVATRLLGPTIAAAAFVKYSLLLLIHALTYGLAGRFVGDERVRFMAGFSPLLIYPLAWRIHEADTHGLLATVLVLLLFWQALRMAEARGAAGYALLGVIAGLALLTSLYLIIALIALAVALRLDHRHAATISDTRLALSIGVMMLVFLPYGYWLAGHWFEALASLDVELRAGLEVGFATRIVTGLGALIAAVALSVFPLWLFVPLIVPRTATRLGHDDDERLVLTYCAAALALLLLFLVMLGVSEFSHFRLYPVFWPLSLYLFRRIDRAGFAPRRARFMAALLAAVFVMVVQLRVQQIFVGPAYCKTCRLQAPYPQAARLLFAAGFHGQGTILADDEYLAGNMRVQFPQARVLAARYPLFRPPARGDGNGQCLLVWHAETGARLPPRLAGLARHAAGMEIDPIQRPGTVEAVVPYSDTALARRRTILLAYLLPDKAVGTCR
ncbi:MAG: glycosyltransferase family 39 protein [Alphaproteobacteria bacterium]|nr:glycosyltransferase family 39 protein [Alphaproteobacteria bacterium]